MITAAVASPKGSAYCQGSALVWICLHYRRLLPFNVLFRQHAGVSLLRHSIAASRGDGILTVSAIGSASRLCLRTRLTLIRLALIRKPWSYGEGASYPLYRYLCLHLLFQNLQHGSIHIFNGAGMLPYQPCTKHGSTTSVPHLCPIIIHAQPLDR